MFTTKIGTFAAVVAFAALASVSSVSLASATTDTADRAGPASSDGAFERSSAIKCKWVNGMLVCSF
jgi:hypothetical protein